VARGRPAQRPCPPRSNRRGPRLRMPGLGGGGRMPELMALGWHRRRTARRPDARAADARQVRRTPPPRTHGESVGRRRCGHTASPPDAGAADTRQVDPTAAPARQVDRRTALQTHDNATGGPHAHTHGKPARPPHRGRTTSQPDVATTRTTSRPDASAVDTRQSTGRRRRGRTTSPPDVGTAHTRQTHRTSAPHTHDKPTRPSAPHTRDKPARHHHHIRAPDKRQRSPH
jgi:hypothetical protein